MAFRAMDGSALTVDLDILDDNDSPVVPRPGFPKVTLLDQDKSVIAQYNAVPTATPGQWESAIVLPELGVTQTTEYRLRWRCLSSDGEKYQFFDNLLVDPKADRRDSEIVLLTGDTIAEFSVPLSYTPAMNGTYQIYSGNNEQLLSPKSLADADVTVNAGFDRTAILIPAIDIPPSLKPNLLMLRATVRGRPKSYSFKYWNITPQIALAMTLVEDFLNKSRIENIIPELEYTSGDLVGYLERGLYMFNMTGMPTGFTGTNMQGMLLDAWIICTTYWALGAQLMAEGSLAFDFSGQGVSLNVDRTPQLDSALGRIEARIQDTVVPLKKQITAQGFFSGDGSIGATQMRNPYATGVLSVINAPTTRVNGFNNFIGRRF